MGKRNRQNELEKVMEGQTDKEKERGKGETERGRH